MLTSTLTLFPSDPLIVHVANMARALQLVHISCVDEKRAFVSLGNLFWPGPLTIIVRAADCIPTAVTAETGFVGIRIPSHALALALIEKADVPVAAPRYKRLNPNLIQLNPNLSQFNPNLSQLNPNLSQFNPNLSQLNPNLSQFNPDLSRLNRTFIPPSANRFGHVSPTKAAHVMTDFREHGAIDQTILILDGEANCTLADVTQTYHS